MPRHYVEEESKRHGFSPTMDVSTLARMDEATVFLQRLNNILAEANMVLLLEPLATQGDGYCFFYVAARVCGMDVSQTAARQVFACALEASCAVHDASDAFEDNVDEKQQRVVELLQHQEYAAEVMFRSPFELSVLDKLEALLLKKRVLETRRFGDSAELCALLRRVGATFLKLDVTENRAHYLLPSGTHIASLEQAADILITQAVDGILLHWFEEQFEHY